MPLQKLQFRPGVNREGTSLSNEGGWYESDKIRFRSGLPEKIGGWVRDTGTQYQTGTELLPPVGSFWGVCRSLFNWLNLAGFNLLGLGTNLKYYIQDSTGGNLYDVTPVRLQTTVASNAFTTTFPSDATIVRCNVTSHGAQAGDFFTISGVAGPINGIPAADLNKEHRVVTVLSSNAFTIVVANGATSAGTTGAATFAFQTTIGNEVYSTAAGWGAGGWGGVTTGFPNTGWGETAATGVGVNLRLWSQSNFGENLLFNARGGAMNFWAVNSSPTTFNRGQVIVAGSTITQKDYATGSGTVNVPIDSTCPSQVNRVLVSDASRFTIAFGCNDPTGINSTFALDPMQIRWADQESYSIWSPEATNQAGGYRLSNGSQIVTAVQTRQEILIWTDTALYSMQFLGAPFVWGFQIMGDNTSIIGPNAAVTANGVTYWMGTDKFYTYNGRVDPLPCSIRQFVFTNINLEQGFQVSCGTNAGYNEIWWYYCSSNSTTVDRYVIYNYLENAWSYGTLARTAWLDSPLRAVPMGAGYNGQLLYHESGNDDGSTSPAAPIYAYIRSSDFDIGDGYNFGFIWRIIPDLTFDGSNVNQPTVNFTVLPRQNPGAPYGPSENPDIISAQNYTAQRTYAVQQFTQYAYVRIRGRQMALQVSSEDLGVAWQLGTPRIEIRADGRR